MSSMVCFPCTRQGMSERCPVEVIATKEPAEVNKEVNAVFEDLCVVC